MELKDDRLKVAVFLESAYLTNRELLKGFLKYTRLHGDWTPVLRTGRVDEPSRRSVRITGCAAVITDHLDATLRRDVAANNIPVVTVLDDRDMPERVAHITCDDDSVAQLAAEHLVGRGFRSFAYVGGDFVWSRVRGAAFRRRIIRLKMRCTVYDPTKAPLADFLASLPHPVGLFAANDVLAQPILTAARTAGLNVPEDVAVIGVDDDEILCESSEPTLTSIRWNTEEIGYRLGEILHEILSTTSKTPIPELRYAGASVTVRASTAQCAEADGLVRRCRELIEINDPKHLSVEVLAEKLHVSRRTLERRFLAAIGCTLGKTLVDHRLERAEQFLRTTNLTQGRIAIECGFYDASHLTAAFRRHRHVLPSAYR